ncbi:MAG: HAD family hydrolase [Candidatus Omnitrophica bacterium]|nr:HAD family hydrolase [Candidatus Omnitrophota bacterium]
MIQAVIFDLDGTLVDSFEDIAHAANHALTSLGHEERSFAEIKSHVGHGLRNLLSGLVSEANSEEIDRMMELVKSYYMDHPTDFTNTYPGASEMLDRLAELGIQTGVLSNKLDSLVQKIAVDLGFADKMGAVWGHREGFPLKPDPTSLLAILAEMGVSPAECLVVGDASPDRLLARNAGTQFCGVTFGMTDRSGWEGEGVDWCVDSLEEIAELTETIAAGRTD